MSKPSRIYLDYAATTPVDPRVLSVMLPFFTQTFGNPSSVHSYGQQAESALEDARETIASGMKCRPDEVIFTSCGSESDNLAIRGVAFARREISGADHLLISPVEHHAVSRTCEHLAQHYGFQVEYLPVDAYGGVDPADVSARIRKNTALVSVIYANNEIGTINPISDIASSCSQAGVPFHTDAVQAAAYLPVDVKSNQVDLMAMGAHKFYGPKGVGALFLRKGIGVFSQITGGGQEMGLRAGTSNIPYIVGMAEAFRLAQTERQLRINHVRPLRDYMMGRILEDIPGARLTGHPTNRLPNHASFVFDGIDGNKLLMLLDMNGFACSSGSACKTGNPEPSDVLTAIGLPRSWALGSLRVTMGLDTTEAEIAQFLSQLPGLAEKARNL